MPGAHCTRSLVRAGVVEYAHEYSQRRHRKHPAFPTQWFYGQIAESVGRIGAEGVIRRYAWHDDRLRFAPIHPTKLYEVRSGYTFNNRMCYSVPHAELSSCKCIGWVLLLHGEPAGTAADPSLSTRSLCCARRSLRRGGVDPFAIDALVVLPDHLHAIWTLPPDDRDFSTRWRLIKSRFAKALPKRERLSNVRIGRGERGIWQRRFWEHLIRNKSDYARHVDYCYINPVKHGLVKQRWRDGGLRFAPIRPTKFHPVTRTAQG